MISGRWRHWGFWVGILPAALVVYGVAMHALLELRKINLRGESHVELSSLTL